ncbi:unnamed protein product [Calypogeia fissa]
MAANEPSRPPVGSSNGGVAGAAPQHGPSSERSAAVGPAVGGAGRPARGRSDQHHNPLKAPLLKKVQARSRHITREESRIKHTWVYITTFFAVMGNIALGFGLGYTAPIQAEMQADLNLSTSQFSTVGSLITLGAMAGAIISGRVADYFGRKGGLILSCIPSIGGFLLVAFAQSTIPLYVGRFATGLAGGVVCFIVPTLVAETAPRHLRGSLGTMQQFSITVGILLAYALGIFMSWRLLAAAGTIPCIISLIGFIFVPESPFWLAKLEKAEDLELSLQKFRGKDYNISHELSDIKATAEAAKHEPKSKLTDLFQKRYMRPLLVGCGVMALQQLSCVNGVLLYSTAILLAAGVPSATLAALSIAVLQVIMTLTSAGLVDRAGRRLLLLVSSSGMTISLFFVALSFYVKETADEATMSSGMEIFIDILALASLLVFIATFSIGYGPVPWVIMSEIFPHNVKANAGSMASLVNWSSAWLITMTFNFLLEWSTSGSFWLFSAINLCSVIFVALWVPETRGKTLDQIEQSFK